MLGYQLCNRYTAHILGWHYADLLGRIEGMAAIIPEIEGVLDVEVK